MKHSIRRKKIQPNFKMLLVSVAFVISQLTAMLPSVQAQPLSAKKIYWGASKMTLKNAFEEIERLTGASISYNNTQLNLEKVVQVEKSERSVAEIMSILLNGSALTYKIAGEKNILIVPKAQPAGKISGKVTDEQGESLPGASVKVVELNRSVTADTYGHYTIAVPPGTYTLEVNYISFAKATVSGVKVAERGEVTRNFKLKQTSNALTEVVVTALGIKREEKSLGYAATVVKGEDLTNAVSGNWTDALSGKVAGLNLVRSNSGPTGSNKIILRGENNLTGDNEALIVVDGVVINNSSGKRTAVSGEAVYGTSSDNMPADYGSGLNDINPENIESITVLKGPAAAALYGQRGANGAVIITTKSGSQKAKSFNVTVNSNISYESPNRWPDMQFEYGQGLDGAPYYSYGASADGASTSGTSSAYGPKFDGQQFFQYDPLIQAVGTSRTAWVPYTNKIRDFFQTGQTVQNSISIDGNLGGTTTARFSASDLENSWIMPNTGYKRSSFALALNSKVTSKLNISTKLNYTRKWSDNLPGAGYGNQSLMYWFIFWQPNADIDWLKNYWQLGKEGTAIKYPYSSFPENPYAVSYEFLNKSDRDNMTGNVTASYNFTKSLSLQLRSTFDFGYEERSQQRPYDAGTKLPKGSYRTQDIYSQETGFDFLVKYDKKVTNDFQITASGGGSILKNKYNKRESRADSLIVPGLYTLANSMGPIVSIPDTSRYQINSFYGLVSAGYKDYLYLDLTGRQDWNSVLATPDRTDNVGFFYPSASLSFILSEYKKLPKFISFAKLRGSVAQVGSGSTTPYRTSYTYSLAGNGIYPGNALQNPGLLPNPDLKPLITTTYEAGADIRLFQNRLNFDVAVYTGNTRNQILTRIVDRSSGYSSALINAGQVNNKGFELSMNATPIAKKDGFRWTTSFAFSSNKNKIVRLADSSVVLRTGPVGGGQIVAKVGGSMGDLYGRGYVRSPDGQVVYDANTGFAKITSDVIYLGNTIPKFKTSFGSTFAYKQFQLNVLFDAQIGAVAHSLMNYKMVEQGKLTSTLPGRYNGIIGNGVIQNADGTYRPNDVLTFDIDEYYRSHMGADNAEGSTFSTDFLKFREARFDYSLSRKVLQNVGLKRATLGVYGRNLFIWSPWPMFDPEFGTLSGTDIVTGFEVGQFPSTRTFGFNLTVGF